MTPIRFAEVHVYGSPGIAKGTEIVLRNCETGEEVELPSWARVSSVDRNIRFGEVVHVSIGFRARLVEHEEADRA